MGACLVQKTQPLDDAVVQVNELCFGEAIYVDLRCHHSFSFKGRTRPARAALGMQ
jgi:hypothetical protein